MQLTKWLEGQHRYPSPVMLDNCRQATGQEKWQAPSNRHKWLAQCTMSVYSRFIWLNVPCQFIPDISGLMYHVSIFQIWLAHCTMSVYSRYGWFIVPCQYIPDMAGSLYHVSIFQIWLTQCTMSVYSRYGWFIVSCQYIPDMAGSLYHVIIFQIWLACDCIPIAHLGLTEHIFTHMSP